MTNRRPLTTPRSRCKPFAWLIAGVLSLSALLPHSVSAQGRLDVPAQGKIDEAINVHYLATDFVKAEQLLAGTINACGNQCSPPIIAKAWMYIGIVRGAGNSDIRGAKEAFRNAFATYPAVDLDSDLATEDVQAAFAEVQVAAPMSGGATPVAPAAPAAPAPAAPAAPPTPMDCEPKVQEVQTRRPIPLACVSQTPGVVRANVYFREYGAPSFTREPMRLQDGRWVGEVPCTATGLSGTLSWYVEATDAQGNRLDGFGTATGPVDVALSNDTDAEPPRLPGQAAPERCADLAECPPEMLGTPACPGTSRAESAGGGKAWGAACAEHTECQTGLACLDGTCETAPFCSVDADCEGGHCDDAAGTCAYDDGGSSSGVGPVNMVGVSIGIDLAFVSGTGICDQVENPDFACYLNDEPYVLADPIEYAEPAADGAIVKAYGGNGVIGSAFAPGSIRLLASYDRMVTANISVGANVGLAFSPIPDGPTALHIDGHGKYWFSGNGDGLKLFTTLGFGLGRVDASKSVQVLETAYRDTGYWMSQSTDGTVARPGNVNPGPRSGGTGYSTGYCPDPDSETCQFAVDATTSYGTTFLALGIGAWLNLGGHGPQAELLGKILFPKSGVSLQPTVTYVIGF